MEYIKEININEAVIHVLDSNADEPILNEFGLELTDEVYTFLLKHIQKCLKDEDLKYANFKEDTNVVKEVSQEYLNGHNNLLDTSKELAKELFILMKAKGNIPSCDLISVYISTEYGPMLGILKMDYIKSYMHTIDFKSEKIGINIIPQFTGLPGSGQKIQKAAFIKPIRQQNTFNLMVIDKQKKSKNDDEYGANYFIENYLGCTVIDNERDSTKKFYTAAETWTRRNLSDNADKAEKVRTAVKKVLKNDDEINVNEFAKEVFKDNATVAGDFIEFAKNQEVKEIVQIDKEYVDKKLKRTRLKIDNDIDVYLNEDVYHDNNRFEIKRNGDGSINIVIKHVRNYIEK